MSNTRERAETAVLFTVPRDWGFGLHPGGRLGQDLPGPAEAVLAHSLFQQSPWD